MKATDIYQARPGDMLLLCCRQGRTEDMVRAILHAMPQAMRDAAALNAFPALTMELCPDETPGSFRDLSALCGKLILAAGKRSHFGGLLLLNLAGLMQEPFEPDRLRALGEVLDMPDGLASRCVTVFYGPTDEEQLLILADLLDFSGRLQTAWFDLPAKQVSLKTHLKAAGLACASPKAARLMEAALEEMREEERFSPLRFLQSCAAGASTITEHSARAAISDPYSYLNRWKKLRELEEDKEKNANRRIGFRS